MKDLNAIDKAIIKVEKFVIEYKKEAADCFRTKEVDRVKGQKAMSLLSKLNEQYDTILSNNCNNGIFI